MAPKRGISFDEEEGRKEGEEEGSGEPATLPSLRGRRSGQIVIDSVDVMRFVPRDASLNSLRYSTPFLTDFRLSLSFAFQILLSADYETPKDLVNRLPLLTEVDEDDLEGEDDDYDVDDDDDDYESTAHGAGSSSPNISLLTGVTSLASIDGAVRRSQMRAGMRGRRGRGARSMTATTTTTSRTTLSSDVSLKSGDKRELFLEVSYSDPRDSKLYTEPGADPAADSLVYKLYVGGKFGRGGEHYYYCRPYGHVYQSIEVKGEAAPSKSGEAEDEKQGRGGDRRGSRSRARGEAPSPRP